MPMAYGIYIYWLGDQWDIFTKLPVYWGSTNIDIKDFLTEIYQSKMKSLHDIWFLILTTTKLWLFCWYLTQTSYDSFWKFRLQVFWDTLYVRQNIPLSEFQNLFCTLMVKLVNCVNPIKLCSSHNSVFHGYLHMD